MARQFPRSPAASRDCVKYILPFANCYLLTAHILRIQAAGDGSICCSLDDGPAVREKSKFVRFAPESEYVVVVLYFAVRLQALADLTEIDRPVPFVDLHRISPAQRDMPAALSVEVN